MAEKKVTLKSSDGELFEVEEVVAVQSQTIKRMIENNPADMVIHLPIVDGKTLAKVIEFCKKHVDAPKPKNEGASSDELKIWDAKFVKVEGGTLRDLGRAAKYLEVESLRELTIQRGVEMIIGKTPAQIRQAFNIKNEFTPEEEEKFRREHERHIDQ